MFDIFADKGKPFEHYFSDIYYVCNLIRGMHLYIFMAPYASEAIVFLAWHVMCVKAPQFIHI